MIEVENREELFEQLYEFICEINDLVIEYGLPNIEGYNNSEDEIEDEDLAKTLELLKDLSDIVKQQI